MKFDSLEAKYKFFGVIATLGLFAAVVVHGMTFAGVDVFERFPLALSLHIGIFVVFVPFVIYAKSKYGEVESLGVLFAGNPPWVKGLAIAVGAYAFVNFGLFAYNSEGGVAEIKNGEFVLQSHGAVIRHLTEEEYHLQKAYVARGFSGHWMVFYLIPALYFLLQTPTRRNNVG